MCFHTVLYNLYRSMYLFENGVTPNQLIQKNMSLCQALLLQLITQLKVSGCGYNLASHSTQNNLMPILAAIQEITAYFSVNFV